TVHSSYFLWACSRQLCLVQCLVRPEQALLTFRNIRLMNSRIIRFVVSKNISIDRFILDKPKNARTDHTCRDHTKATRNVQRQCPAFGKPLSHHAQHSWPEESFAQSIYSSGYQDTYPCGHRQQI